MNQWYCYHWLKSKTIREYKRQTEHALKMDMITNFRVGSYAWYLCELSSTWLLHEAKCALKGTAEETRIIISCSNIWCVSWPSECTMSKGLLPNKLWSTDRSSKAKACSCIKPKLLLYLISSANWNWIQPTRKIPRKHSRHQIINKLEGDRHSHMWNQARLKTLDGLTSFQFNTLLY